MNFNGEFETHITVALTDPTQWDLLSEWCQARELKCVHIVLDRGRAASQPMFTRQGVGTLASELEAAGHLCQECEAMGLQVSRLKLEVAPWNPDVPHKTEDVSHHGQERYFEHHVKLLLPALAELHSLEAAVVPHGAHLSRNARRTRQDGLQERFVSQRCKGVTRGQAHSQLEELLLAVEALGFPILETEAEFVVFDSNLALDAGWLEPEPA